MKNTQLRWKNYREPGIPSSVNWSTREQRRYLAREQERVKRKQDAYLDAKIAEQAPLAWQAFWRIVWRISALTSILCGINDLTAGSNTIKWPFLIFAIAGILKHTKIDVRK